jgi:hypothetical protein
MSEQLVLDTVEYQKSKALGLDYLKDRKLVEKYSEYLDIDMIFVNGSEFTYDDFIEKCNKFFNNYYSNKYIKQVIYEELDNGYDSNGASKFYLIPKVWETENEFIERVIKTKEWEEKRRLDSITSYGFRVKDMSPEEKQNLIDFMMSEDSDIKEYIEGKKNV